jgi:hypothetical protein
MAPPVVRRITLKITLAASGSIDYKFADNSFSYLGSIVKTVFNEMLLRNNTNNEIYYSIEEDQNDTITVDGTATQGVMRVERKSSISEMNSQINRLRITSVTAGDVYVILYHNPRAFL